MNLYILIHEQDTDDGCSCTVSPFLDKDAAQDVMNTEWQTTVQECGYNAREHDEEDECECSAEKAIIREGINVEVWRIDTHNLDVQVAVRVEGGLVGAVLANADVEVEVFDLDVSECADDDEQDEVAQKEAKLEELSHAAGWKTVY